MFRGHRIDQIFTSNDHLNRDVVKFIDQQTKEIKSILNCLESQNEMYRNVATKLSQMTKDIALKSGYDTSSQILIDLDAQTLIMEKGMNTLLNQLNGRMLQKRALSHQHGKGLHHIATRHGLSNQLLIVKPHYQHSVTSENQEISKDQKIQKASDNVADGEPIEVAISNSDNSEDEEIEIVESGSDSIGNKNRSSYLYYVECKECDKPFYSRMEYQNHMKVVHGIDKAFECDQCDKRYSTKRTLMAHIEKKHGGIMRYGCDICRKRFYAKGDWKRHCRIHTDERPFKCSHCGSSFKQKSHLNIHIRSVHQKEVKYRCVLCSKGFYMKSDLTMHLRVHTGERPFQCKVCRKAFKTKNQLREHEKTHSGKKPYKCSKCQKPFTRCANMRRHEIKCSEEDYRKEEHGRNECDC